MLTTSILLAACQPASAPATPVTAVVRTIVVTQEIQGPMVISVVTPTPMNVVQPDTLTICGGREPLSLYPYGKDRQAAASVLAAIYDGPFDVRGFTPQAVILSKIPSLADGDASLQSIIVQAGDRVVDAYGRLVTLDANANPKIELIPSSSSEGDASTSSTNASSLASTGSTSAVKASIIEYQGGKVTLDQLTVTFKLLPGLKWSDGSPMTVRDSVYAFHLLADPATPVDKTLVEHTASYEAVDELTIRWTGLPGFHDPNYALNFVAPLPEHAWSKSTAAQLLTANASSQRPLGWGAYKVSAWEKGERITLQKNSNYFHSEQGLPKFNTLVFRYFNGNYNASLAALLADECDLVDSTAGLETQSGLLLALNSAGKLQAVFQTGTAWQHLDFGIQPASYDDGYDNRAGDRADFFSNERVRQALASCLDRPTVIKEVLAGQSPLLSSYLPPLHPLFNPATMSYNYDPATGMSLLAQAGWEDIDGDQVLESNGVEGIPFNTEFSVNYYYTGTTATSLKVAQILSRSLENCGIQVHLTYLPPQAWTQPGPEGLIQGRRFDLAQTASPDLRLPGCQDYLAEEVPGALGTTWKPILAPFDEPQHFQGNWQGTNISGFYQRSFENACKTALSLLPGQPGYQESMLAAQAIFAEQLPGLPLYLQVRVAAARPDLCGFNVPAGTDNELWNIEEFGYGSLCK